jgi:hypothetical protein
VLRTFYTSSAQLILEVIQVKNFRSLVVMLLSVLFVSCSITPVPNNTSTLTPQAEYWSPLGSRLDNVATKVATVPALAINPANNNLPIAVWQENSGTSEDIWVKQWDGSTWTSWGRVDRAASKNATTPSIAVDGAGYAYIAWSEEGTATSGTNIYVRRGRNGSWSNIGNQLDFVTNNPTTNPSIAIDSTDSPTVAWQESGNIYVKQWDGFGWVSLGAELDVNVAELAEFPVITLDSSDYPIVAWSENNTVNGNYDVYVKRWDGSSWTLVGGVLDTNAIDDSRNPSIVTDGTSNIFVAFESSGDIVVKRWDGTSWGAFAGALDITLANTASSPSLSQSSSGTLYTAWSESSAGNGNIYVKSWNGTAWVSLASSLDNSATRNATNPSLAVSDAGKVYAVWQEFDGTSESIYSKQWLTGAWLGIGGALDNASTQESYSPSMDINRNGVIAVAWQEYNPLNATQDIYVKRRTGTGNFVALGAAVDKTATRDTYYPSLRVGTDGFPVVAFSEYNPNNGDYELYVKRWNGTSWVLLGTKLNTLYSDYSSQKLALDNANNPIVAWDEGGDLVVKKWDGVSAWVQLGSALDISTSYGPNELSIAVDTTGAPFVAWDEYSPTNGSDNVVVKRWDSTISDWVQLGGALDKQLSNNTNAPSLAVDRNNRPIVAWEESNNIFVKAWNGTSWVLLGTGVLNKSIWNSAYSPSIDTDDSNNPAVAWVEYESPGYSLYVKRWTGSGWLFIGGSTERSTFNSIDTSRISLALRRTGEPFTAWSEYFCGATACSYDIFVSTY